MSDITSISRGEDQSTMNLIVTSSFDQSVKLWDIRQAKCVQSHKSHKGVVNVAKLTPDGQWIASGGEDKNIFV